MKRFLKWIPIAAILLVATLVRLWGINYDLPYIYHPDEHTYINISQNMVKTGDLNPHFFNYPSLFFYINAAAYIPYYLWGRLAGVFQSSADIQNVIPLAMGVTKAPLPSAVLLGRMITVSFGVATTGIMYHAGTRLSGKRAVGLLVAFLLAIGPTNVMHSRLVTPDTLVTFFVSATLLASILLYQQGKLWQYVVAGLMVGFTASSKYNGGIVILTMIAAHFIRCGTLGFRNKNIYIALLSSGIGFLATTPFALLDFNKFFIDLTFEAKHYSTGHSGMEGNTLSWYLTYMWNTGGVLYIIAALGMVYGYFKFPEETLLAISFPLIYFVFINNFVVRNDRIFLPITPFLFLFAAWFLIEVFYAINKLNRQSTQKIFRISLVAIGIIACLFSMNKTFADTTRLTTVNSRETARLWISNNVSPGSKVAIESYAPFVDPTRFQVQSFYSMIDQEPQWYIDQEFDYLVFSQGMYGRFYREPKRYSNEIRHYDTVFSHFKLVKAFSDGGYEVRIYTPYDQ